MGNVFGKAKPLKEVLRENKRMINKAVRELDRERANLEREEKKLVADIKKFAKEQQMGTVKIMAKVRIWRGIGTHFWGACLCIMSRWTGIVIFSIHSLLSTPSNPSLSLVPVAVFGNDS